jgi:hypothetical protein
LLVVWKNIKCYQKDTHLLNIIRKLGHILKEANLERLYWNIECFVLLNGKVLYLYTLTCVLTLKAYINMNHTTIASKCSQIMDKKHIFSQILLRNLFHRWEVSCLKYKLVNVSAITNYTVRDPVRFQLEIHKCFHTCI